MNRSGFIFRRYLITLLAVVLLVAPFEARSEEEASVRSTIQAVDGYAYLAEDKTLSELRSAALNNAKQQALANANTFIRSRTEVDNFVLKSDSVLINAEGTVKILEQKDEGIRDNSRYHIWIRAEVEYLLGDEESYETAGAGAEKGDLGSGQSQSTGAVVKNREMAGKDGPLTVKVWSTKKQYAAGEKIVILLQGNRDFYARIVDINSNGDIVQLLPNEFRPSTLFAGGRVYTIPGPGDRFDLTVSPPFGTDKIVVYSSDVPLGEVDLKPVGQGLGIFAGSQESLGVRTRGISVTARTSEKTVSHGEPAAIAEFYEAHYDITTHP